MLAARIVLVAAVVNFVILVSALAIECPACCFLTRRNRMLAETAFSFADASVFQVIAFVGGAIAAHRLFRVGRLAYPPVAARSGFSSVDSISRSAQDSSPMTYYLVIFAAGFLGSFHCIGMCGGFACALGRDPRGGVATVGRHLLYNFGRLTTYCFLGALAGALGQAVCTAHGAAVPSPTARSTPRSGFWPSSPGCS